MKSVVKHCVAQLQGHGFESQSKPNFFSGLSASAECGNQTVLIIQKRTKIVAILQFKHEFQILPTNCCHRGSFITLYDFRSSLKETKIEKGAFYFP